jgi:hypothetical protein
MYVSMFMMMVNNMRLASCHLDEAKAVRVLERLKGYDQLPHIMVDNGSEFLSKVRLT